MHEAGHLMEQKGTMNVSITNPHAETEEGLKIWGTSNNRFCF